MTRCPLAPFALTLMFTPACLSEASSGSDGEHQPEWDIHSDEALMAEVDAGGASDAEPSDGTTYDVHSDEVLLQEVDTGGTGTVAVSLEELDASFLTCGGIVRGSLRFDVDNASSAPITLRCILAVSATAVGESSFDPAVATIPAGTRRSYICDNGFTVGAFVDAAELAATLDFESGGVLTQVNGMGRYAHSEIFDFCGRPEQSQAKPCVEAFKD